MVRSHIQLWRRRRRLPLRPPQVTPAPMRRCALTPAPPARELALGTVSERVRLEEHRAVDLRPRRAPRALPQRRFDHPGVLVSTLAAPRLPLPAASARPLPAAVPAPPIRRSTSRERRWLLLAAAIALLGGLVAATLSDPASRLQPPRTAEPAATSATSSEVPHR